MKAGSIKFVPADDPIEDSARLRIEVVDDDGSPIGELELVADDLTWNEQREAVALFAYNVDEARRKPWYLQHHENREQVLNEMREDFFDWSFRQRGERERWEGLGDDALSTAQLQRQTHL